HKYFHICTKFLNKTNGQTLVEKSTASYVTIRREYLLSRDACISLYLCRATT
ncbi:Os02g0121600, partial [Oryza sativa Japonica Group]